MLGSMKQMLLLLIAFVFMVELVEGGRKPKVCIGENGKKYKKGQGYTHQCTKFTCVKKGAKLKMVAQEISSCVPSGITPGPEPPQGNLAANVSALEASVASLKANMESIQDMMKQFTTIMEQLETLMNNKCDQSTCTANSNAIQMLNSTCELNTSTEPTTHQGNTSTDTTSTTASTTTSTTTETITASGTTSTDTTSTTISTTTNYPPYPTSTSTFSTTPSTTATQTITSVVSTPICGSSPKCITTKGKECIFPFIDGGKSYNSCKKWGNTFWCATSLLSSGKWKTWQYCDKDVCPLEGVTTNPACTTPDPNAGEECVCGLAQRSTRITGGGSTEINEYPWLVGFRLIGGSRPGCGGSLINDRWIITAAHCTAGVYAGMSVILGEHDVTTSHESTMIKRSIAKVVNHPNFSGTTTLDFDFSLLKISSPINFKEYRHIRPICLPSVPNTGPLPDHEGERAIVAGWGMTSSSGPLANKVQEAEVSIYSRAECDYAWYDYSSDMTICAGDPQDGSGACKGDSGGPLMYTNGTGTVPGQNYQLIGVVSFGNGKCTTPEYPGMYAKVSYVIDWIKQTVNDGIWCPRIPQEQQIPLAPIPGK